jgi:hypothetical protein
VGQEADPIAGFEIKDLTPQHRAATCPGIEVGIGKAPTRSNLDQCGFLCGQTSALAQYIAGDH